MYFVTVQYEKKALNVHMTGAGHRNKRPEVNQIQSYFYNAGSSSSLVSGENSGSISPSISFVSKSQTPTAEILWALHTVKNNYLANSCDKVIELNKKMYPDSAIAQSVMPHGLNQFVIYDKFWPWTTFPKHLAGSNKQIQVGTVYLLMKATMKSLIKPK